MTRLEWEKNVDKMRDISVETIFSIVFYFNVKTTANFN